MLIVDWIPKVDAGLFREVTTYARNMLKSNFVAISLRKWTRVVFITLLIQYQTYLGTFYGI